VYTGETSEMGGRGRLIRFGFFRGRQEELGQREEHGWLPATFLVAWDGLLLPRIQLRLLIKMMCGDSQGQRSLVVVDMNYVAVGSRHDRARGDSHTLFGGRGGVSIFRAKGTS